MKTQAVALTDDQAATLIQRGSAVTLTIFEAELHDPERGTYIPAKSVSITNTNGLKQLRDLLNTMDLEFKEVNVS
jgi:hypothetical protein